MPWGWYLGWTAVWELVGLGAVLTLAWFLLDGAGRRRRAEDETHEHA